MPSCVSLRIDGVPDNLFHIGHFGHLLVDVSRLRGGATRRSIRVPNDLEVLDSSFFSRCNPIGGELDAYVGYQERRMQMEKRQKMWGGLKQRPQQDAPPEHLGPAPPAPRISSVTFEETSIVARIHEFCFE
jgi:hypothetical protein